jgi:hypothetical protein
LKQEAAANAQQVPGQFTVAGPDIWKPYEEWEEQSG